MSLRKKLNHSIKFLIGFVYVTQAIGLPSDRDQVAYLSANSADLNQSTHKGVYQGDVQFDQGSTHLRALKVITEGDKKNKLIFAAAFGDRKTPAHYWEQTALDKPELNAYAQEIRYYPRRHLIELLGDAHIVQGKDSFASPKIYYDIQKKQLISAKENNHRTVIVIHPEKKP